MQADLARYRLNFGYSFQTFAGVVHILGLPKEILTLK